MRTTELDPIDEITTNDLIQIVDVDDDAMSNTGTNKKVNAKDAANSLVSLADSITIVSTISDSTFPGSKISNNSISGNKLQNTSITNDKIATLAAIDGSKISPNFTGNTNISINNSSPALTITQIGSGTALKISNTIIDKTGKLGVGVTSIVNGPVTQISGTVSDVDGTGLNQGQLFITDSDNITTSGLLIGYRWQNGVAEYGRIQARNGVGATALVLQGGGGNVGIGKVPASNRALDVSGDIAASNFYGNFHGNLTGTFNGTLTGTLTGVATAVAASSIVDASVSVNAAIAGNKITPNFGTQDISTTGNAGIGGAATPANKLAITNSTGSTGTSLNITNSGTGSSLIITSSSTTNNIVRINGGGDSNDSKPAIVIRPNKTIVIGNTIQRQTPDPHFVQIHGETDNTSTLQIYRADVVTGAGSIVLSKSRGSLAVPDVVSNGDRLGTLSFCGYSTSLKANFAALIRAEVDGAVTTDKVPGRLIFQTANVNGGLEERLRITSSGNVGVNTPTPTEKLHITGNLKIGDAVLQQPAGAAPIFGARAWVNLNATVPTNTGIVNKTANTNTARITLTAHGLTTGQIVPLTFTSAAKLTTGYYGITYVDDNTFDITVIPADVPDSVSNVSGATRLAGDIGGQATRATATPNTTPITIAMPKHGLRVGDRVYLDFVSDFPDGVYEVIAPVTTDSFTVPYTGNVVKTNINVTLKRPRVRASGNVANVSRAGTIGEYFINFETPLSSANYAVIGSGQQSEAQGRGDGNGTINGYPVTAQTAYVNTVNVASNFEDWAHTSAVIFG